MVDHELLSTDEFLHVVGPERSWNESRYVDFYDSELDLGGWLRLGMRPNEGHAEMSACVYLPSGDVAFQFDRADIETNGLAAGGQSWFVGEPFRDTRVRYDGPMLHLRDGWQLLNPRLAREQNPLVDVELELQVTSLGRQAVMGRRASDIDQIFIPGQADRHYQHLCSVTGQISLGGSSFRVTGQGGKDHSWGPRNWLSKIYLRWFTAQSLDGTVGFMVMRTVGPTKQTRGGHLVLDGQFHLIEELVMTNVYAHLPPYGLEETILRMTVAGGLTVQAVGRPQRWLPLRHRSVDEHGEPSTLRIVKSPMLWTFQDGRPGAGSAELHDRLSESGIPAGLHD